MRMIWILEALRALANRLLPGTRRSRSPSCLAVTTPFSEFSQAATDSEHPKAGSIPNGDLDQDECSSEEQPHGGLVDGDKGTAQSNSSAPESRSNRAPPEQESPSSIADSSDQPSPNLTEDDSEHPVSTASLVDDDQGRCPPEIDGHPKEDGAEDLRDGNAHPGKPPKSNCKPRDIGGMRDRERSMPKPEQRSQCQAARPELICRRGPASTTWEIVVTADEEYQFAAVQLEGEQLGHGVQECRVPAFTGRLTVLCQDGQRHTFPLFGDDPLIFKLRRNWSGEGRRIRRITSGHFIVIAPASWERKGRAPVEPDGCSDTAFRAHYFHREANATNGGLEGFHEWSDLPVASGIELDGRRVFDDSDEGDLFVGNAPSLRSSPKIVWARVGEETERGWGQDFLPHAQSISDVLDGRQGRFFLRVYDSEVRLLDSTAFRYLRNLQRIRVNGTDYSRDSVVVPTSSGHSATEVRFVGADGSTIVPILQTGVSQAAAPSGALVVPPNPDADRISCTLAAGAYGVDIVLDLSRIWWRLEDGRPESVEWQDTPIVMTRQEFRKHAYSNVAIALLSRRFGSVRAGFDDELTQPYRRVIKDDRIAIPLAHFVDHAQIDRRRNEDAHFNVAWAGEIVPLIVISADPMPEILSFTAEPAVIFVGEEALLEWTTRSAGDARVSIDPDVGVVDSDGTLAVRPSRTTKYTLVLAVSDTDGISSTVAVTVEQLPIWGRWPAVCVKSTGGRWRRGKGFGFRELQDAGVTVEEAAELSIPIDRRRRTSHRANVERVRSMVDG